MEMEMEMAGCVGERERSSSQEFLELKELDQESLWNDKGSV